MNLGKIATALEELDNSDDMPEFSDEEYNTIDEIRHLTMKSCAKWQNFLRKKNTYANAGISTRFLTVSPAAMISLP